MTIEQATRLYLKALAKAEVADASGDPARINVALMDLGNTRQALPGTSLDLAAYMLAAE